MAWMRMLGAEPVGYHERTVLGRCDHCLVANVLAMGDQQGGWKAFDTGLLRDQLHAATAIGRMAAARAVELGYGSCRPRLLHAQRSAAGRQRSLPAVCRAAAHSTTSDLQFSGGEGGI